MDDVDRMKQALGAEEEETSTSCSLETCSLYIKGPEDGYKKPGFDPAENGAYYVGGSASTARRRLSTFDSGISEMGIRSAQQSPMWGEPGRMLPSVSSMLQLPPAALNHSASTTSLYAEDIEDWGKEDKEREGLLIDEIVQAAPKVRLEREDTDNLCPDCRNPNCPVSNPPLGYYSAKQVKGHCTPGDCWIVSHGNIYDCTRYLVKHPGGSRAILNRAGQDVSKDYDFHTRHGKNLWKRFQIGKLAMCPRKSCPNAGGEDTECCIS